jgi:hypothetical protein
MKGATGLGIRFNQLVVGGFVIPGVNLGFESRDGSKAMITRPRYYFAGDFAGKVMMDNDVEHMYHHAIHGDYLGINEPERILNQDRVQVDRRGLRKKIVDFLRPWYHHSSGTISRKPSFPGQEPAKNVVVVKPFGGGFRRGQEPGVSAFTNPNKSVGFKFPERGLNHGLTKAEIEAMSGPVIVQQLKDLRHGS